MYQHMGYGWLGRSAEEVSVLVLPGAVACTLHGKVFNHSIYSAVDSLEGDYRIICEC